MSIKVRHILATRVFNPPKHHPTNYRAPVTNSQAKYRRISIIHLFTNRCIVAPVRLSRGVQRQLLNNGMPPASASTRALLHFALGWPSRWLPVNRQKSKTRPGAGFPIVLNAKGTSVMNGGCPRMSFFHLPIPARAQVPFIVSVKLELDCDVAVHVEPLVKLRVNTTLNVLEAPVPLAAVTVPPVVLEGPEFGMEN
jgi:hypothetical protein